MASFEWWLLGNDGKFNPTNDPTTDLAIAWWGGLTATIAGGAGVYEGTKWFFNAPKYNSWKHFQQPGGWNSPWETRSPFDRVRGSKVLKGLSWVDFAVTAYEVGFAYQKGGKEGLFDYALETVEENYRIVFPFLNTFFPE